MSVETFSQIFRDFAEHLEPTQRLLAEFAANNWAMCADGLLKKTTRIRVWPEPSPAPLVFDWEIDTPYKRRLSFDGPVELMPGPVVGRLMYRADMFENPDGPAVAVMIDRRLAYFSPHCSPETGLICLGDQNDLPPGPLPLDALLEAHVFPIVSYQNRHPIHTMNPDASRYFALDPTAMEGLEPVQPLY